MELEAYLDYVNKQKTVHAPSEELEYSGFLTQEALKVTMEMNGSYHTPEEVQDLFAQLTLQPVNRTLGLVPPFYTDCGKNIHVGENAFINMGCTMQDQGGIYLGDNVFLGHHATIVTLNHDFDPEKRAELHPRPVHIGDNAWLGANVTVLPGVTIGAGAVVAAGAVVTKDVPENAVVAGVPAKVVKVLSFDHGK